MTTLAQEIGARHQIIEDATRRGQFLSICRLMMLGKGIFGAAKLAEETNASRAVADTLKAATTAVSLSSLADFKLMVDAFVAGLSSYGAFDAMLPSMVKVPLSTTVGAVTTIAAGYVVGEASAKQVSRLSLSNGTIEPQKAHAIVVVANELLKVAGSGTSALLQKELSNAAVLAVDASFISTLLAGVSVGVSSGSTAEAVRADVAGLLSQVPGDATSRYFILTTPLVVKMWAMMGATPTTAFQAFPELTVQGGTMSGMRVVASDALPNVGQVILVDAAQVAANTGAIELSVLSEGSVMSDSLPDSPVTGTTVFTSLWQNNLSALRAERWWGAERLRSTAVASLINANSYATGFSPP
jgi:hypothetical protein